MSTAFPVYFSESLKITIIIVIKNPKPLTSLLASWHSMAFVMCSCHIAEIIRLALLRLADTSLYVCYIIKPVVSPDWTLRQNSLVAKWKILHLRGEDLSIWLCVKYLLEYMQLLRLPGWLFFVPLCYACTAYQSTGNLPKVKQVSWNAGKSKLSFDKCFFLNWFSKTLSLYLNCLLTALWPLHAVGGCAQHNMVTGVGWSLPGNWGGGKEIA